ncbi:MAG: cellulose biosynthesis cyclic di-GMP-binding regulatory protein BcsB, partial [Plesiomonas shigelloides]
MMALSRNTLLLALAMIGGLPELCAAQEYIGDTPAPAVSTSSTPLATTATPSAINANSPNSSENSEQAPVTNLSLSFNQLLPSGILELRNALKTIQMDFGVRSDQIVTDAKLHLIFTPSPAMLPIMSQI